MTVWDILIALSGVEDYAMRFDKERKEVDIARPEDLSPGDKVVPINANRWQRIVHGANN